MSPLTQLRAPDFLEGSMCLCCIIRWLLVQLFPGTRTFQRHKSSLLSNTFERTQVAFSISVGHVCAPMWSQFPSLRTFDWKNMSSPDYIKAGVSCQLCRGCWFRVRISKNAQHKKPQGMPGIKSLTDAWKHLLKLCPSKLLICYWLVQYDQILI